MKNQPSIEQKASRYGLTLEILPLEDHDDAFRVYKGVNQIFIGTEAAVDEFLDRYEQERPKLEKIDARDRGLKE